MDVDSSDEIDATDIISEENSKTLEDFTQKISELQNEASEEESMETTNRPMKRKQGRSTFII